jgi:hypothetical protein
MSAYYSFIAGLPDLEFDTESDLSLPALYPGILEEMLPAEELEWVRLLWLRKFHLEIISWLSGEGQGEGLPAELPVEAFHSANDAFLHLPAYLQQLVLWKENDRGELPPAKIAHRLQQLYFRELLTSGNHFMQEWGESEMNLLNFMAARRSELLAFDKKQQLIPGNNYCELLQEYVTSQKIIHTEFPPAAKLETLFTSANLLERELEIDQLRWNTIDEINRFEYFTIDVVLGYFQKLLLLERWKKIFHSKAAIDPREMAKKLVHL